MKDCFLLAFAALASASFGAAIPKIRANSVSVSGSPDVTVTYELEGDAAIVTAEAFVGGAPLDPQAFTVMNGDVNRKVETGVRSFVWKAGKETPPLRVSDFQVKLRAWPLSNPPDWMVADLQSGDVNYYTTTNAFPLGGLANDIYRKTKLVMRHIPAKNVTWTMGTATNEAGAVNIARAMQHEVTLTKDYWMGIYEVTQMQYDQFSGVARHAVWRTAEDADVRPTENVSFKQLRCSPSDNKWWPQNGHDVADGSPIDRLRLRTGIAFDLPTEAQWEFACRAGTRTPYNNGARLAPGYANLGDIAFACIDEIAWYKYNSAIDGVRQTHPVGLKKPNAWGLYDMHGNVLELCLDQFNPTAGFESTVYFTSEPTVDPTGPQLASIHSFSDRGGDYSRSAAMAMSGDRSNYCGNSWPSSDGTSGPERGFRLCAPIE